MDKLKRTKKKKDGIDYSDIPVKKQSLTIRLDAEIVEWFKQNGSGYQTQINAWS